MTPYLILTKRFTGICSRDDPEELTRVFLPVGQKFLGNQALFSDRGVVKPTGLAFGVQEAPMSLAL